MTEKLLDLFAGAGGLSLGFELFVDERGKQIYELHKAVECDKYSCETLRKRYGSSKVIEGDLTNPKVRKRVIDECRGIVSFVVAGIPCQSFSVIGPRSGYGKKIEKFKNDKRDELYKEFCRIVEAIKPNIIVIENVKGILSKRGRDGEEIINKLTNTLENLGYNLKNNKYQNKYMMLNAADYGVPQTRERVIIIGVKKKWKKIDIPFVEPTHYDPKSCGKINGSILGLLPYVSLYQAIGDLPEVKAKITKTKLTETEISKIEKLNKYRDSGQDILPINGMKKNQHFKTIDHSGRQFLSFILNGENAFIHHHTARGQQASDIDLFNHMKQGETAEKFRKRCPHLAKKLIKYKMDSFKDKYRKQKWNEPCTTVFAHLEKDGNRFIHPEQARTLTPREIARVQSFPDDYLFEGPVSHKFRQIGNAVPPLLARQIAKTIYEVIRC